jgi:hypothetical protein
MENVYFIYCSKCGQKSIIGAPIKDLDTSDSLVVDKLSKELNAVILNSAKYYLLNADTLIKKASEEELRIGIPCIKMKKGQSHVLCSTCGHLIYTRKSDECC